MVVDGKQQEDSVHRVDKGGSTTRQRVGNGRTQQTRLGKAIIARRKELKPQARVATLHSRLYTISNTFSPHCESKESAFENIECWKKYRKSPNPPKMAR